LERASSILPHDGVIKYTCTWTTQHHILEDRELYIYCCDSIKSYTIINEILYALFVAMWKQ